MQRRRRRLGRGGAEGRGSLTVMLGDGEGEEDAPTRLNTSTCGHFLVVTPDKLCVKYTGAGLHGNDVGAIQGNRPAPCHQLLYYFEMTVKDRGLRGCTTIGFTDEHFKNSRQPGWEVNSYGYHGDDGKLFHGQGIIDDFGPTFTTGDTVGAGINYVAQELFFTKNGKIVGTIFKDVKIDLYPTIGLHSRDEKVEVNFGQRPFVFDVQPLVKEEREGRQREVENVPLSPSASHRIVRSYLLHYGYQATLASFDASSGGSSPPDEFGEEEDGLVDEDMYALEQRQLLRGLLAKDGNVDSVLAKLQDWYPQLVQQDHRPTVTFLLFLLHCQKFIELVKLGMVEAAVSYARTELMALRGTSHALDVLLRDCLALLAYERPQESPLAYLLSFGQREVVADAVNAFVLATNPSLPSGQYPQSALEKLLRQLGACHKVSRLFNGGEGEVFRLHHMLHKGKDGGW